MYFFLFLLIKSLKIQISVGVHLGVHQCPWETSYRLASLTLSRVLKIASGTISVFVHL